MAKRSPGRLHWAVHKIIIPTTVVTSSVAILTASYFYHENQLRAQLLSENTSATFAQIGLDSNQQTDIEHHAPPGSASTATVRSAKSKQDHNSSTPSTATKHEFTSSETPGKSMTGSHTDKKPTPSHKQAPGSGAHVSWGTVQEISTEQVQSTAVQSIVTQYGHNPQTSGLAGNLTSVNGGSLTIPSSVDQQRLLATSLNQGVIWAVVSPTTVASDGTRGPALSTTDLYYTPFPSEGAARLTTGAILIGQVPITTENADQLGTAWTHVTNQQGMVPTSNSTDVRADASGSTLSNSQTSSQTASTGNASLQATSTSATGSVGTTRPRQRQIPPQR
ncbi:serine-rich family protein [Alicyclobacillus dauci]|uniref:Uncharacterized protein n=1 Tax=Alicyclobacillus dauci TaxID=1475485 RepID=A0ABY6YZ91_9BACL|nr:hypothetical protein [Alicyclobacillus dauci]WAH35830.1 hypothetical protein NZD86_16365 [Alicyclobacillus dauci]